MSGQIPNNEIIAQWDHFVRPGDGDRFRHYKGGEYEVVATGFLEDSITPCVVYRSLETNIVWVRSAENFLGMIACEDGTRQPRFTSI